MRKMALFLSIALVSFSLLAAPSFAQEKWEYKMVNLAEGLEAQVMAMSMEQLNALLGAERKQGEVNQTEALLKLVEKRLNDMGDIGWELVVVDGQMAIFKRQKGK